MNCGITGCINQVQNSDEPICSSCCDKLSGMLESAYIEKRCCPLTKLFIPEKFHPSEYLKEELKAREITYEEFDRIVGIVGYAESICDQQRDIGLFDSAIIGFALCLDETLFYRLQFSHDRFKLIESRGMSVNHCPLCVSGTLSTKAEVSE